MTATQSRYVVDLNRDPSGAALYAGADNTELCPTRTFADEPIYARGDAPAPDEVTQRTVTHFLPYHHTLADRDRARARTMHGYAILLDGHSIRGEVPRFFAGRLPDLNLGTASGASCAPELQAPRSSVLAASPGFTHVVNGRFKGGWITRHYGRPYDDVHALQLEIAQRCYMDEAPPYAWDAARAAPLVARAAARSSRRSPNGGRRHDPLLHRAPALRRVAGRRPAATRPASARTCSTSMRRASWATCRRTSRSPRCGSSANATASGPRSSCARSRRRAAHWRRGMLRMRRAVAGQLRPLLELRRRVVRRGP